jgi:hypothetical protein
MWKRQTSWDIIEELAVASHLQESVLFPSHHYDYQPLCVDEDVKRCLATNSFITQTLTNKYPETVDLVMILSYS